jgi:hypothetical protein
MLKRIIPFILTFAIGLAVASFFVNIIPSFKMKCGERRNQQQLRYENESLRMENERLKVERDFDVNVVPMRVEESPNVEAPVPPIPPVAPKRVR